MRNTTAQDVYDSFEASFADKEIIPPALELVWLKKAIGRYSVELSELVFDENAMEFNCVLNQYTIDTLGAFMVQSYQERQVSKVNKRVSIVGKDFSVDGAGHTKASERMKLDYDSMKSDCMVHNQKQTAYV